MRAAHGRSGDAHGTLARTADGESIDSGEPLGDYGIEIYGDGRRRAETRLLAIRVGSDKVDTTFVPIMPLFGSGVLPPLSPSPRVSASEGS